MLDKSETRAAKAIDDLLAGVAPIDRLTALIAATIEYDGRAVQVAQTLTVVAGLIAQHLSPSERLALGWCMLEQVEGLNAKWN